MRSSELTTTPEPLTRAAFESELKAARALADSPTPLAQRVMAFEAPYVIEKLVDKGVVRSEAEGKALFDELKKYLLLSQHLGQPLPMTSALVDAAWHQFALFTRQYERFCQSSLGEFCHHVPTPIGVAADAGERAAPGGDPLPLTDDQFRELYEASFGAIPDVWFDSLCVRADTRLLRRRGSDVFSAQTEEEHALLFRGGTELVCRSSARAFEALEFMARHSCFLVRELPRLRAPDEQLALCRPLVRYGILRLAF
jgi:hypothetical protein